MSFNTNESHSVIKFSFFEDISLEESLEDRENHKGFRRNNSLSLVQSSQDAEGLRWTSKLLLRL